MKIPIFSKHFSLTLVFGSRFRFVLQHTTLAKENYYCTMSSEAGRGFEKFLVFFWCDACVCVCVCIRQWSARVFVCAKGIFHVIRVHLHDGGDENFHRDPM